MPLTASPQARWFCWPTGQLATRVNDAGAVTEQAAYDPYGKPDAQGSSKAPGLAAPATSTHGFQGHQVDHKNGSVVMEARLYDPTTKRFTTPDTFVAGAIDMALGTDSLTGNRYLFAAANPASFYDDGHLPSVGKFFKKVAKKALPALAFVPVVGSAAVAAEKLLHRQSHAPRCCRRAVGGYGEGVISRTAALVLNSG